MKVWPKACPKCQGDLKEEVSVFDTYVFCVNCRYTLTHREKASLTEKAPLAAAPSAKPEQK
jgi:hypothetical protein